MTDSQTKKFHKLPPLIESIYFYPHDSRQQIKNSPPEIPEWDFEVLQFLLKWKKTLKFKLDAVLYEICFSWFTDRTIIPVWDTAAVRYDLRRQKLLESVNNFHINKGPQIRNTIIFQK